VITVAQLIASLQNMPQDMRVVLPVKDFGFNDASPALIKTILKPPRGYPIDADYGDPDVPMKGSNSWRGFNAVVIGW